MKDIILKIAIEKIQQHGLRKFTMDEIAEELKISKKTIYKYFSSKDEIIHEYFSEVIKSDMENMTETLKNSKNLIDKLNAIIYSYHKYKLPAHILDESYKFYNNEWAQVQALKDYKLTLINDALKDSVDDGYLKQDIDLKIVALMVQNAADSFFSYKFLSENGMTIQEAINKAIKIILYGIVNQ